MSESDLGSPLSRQAFLQKAGLATGAFALSGLLAPGRLLPQGFAAAGGTTAIDTITWGLNQTVRSLDHIHNFDFPTGETVSLSLEGLLRYDAKGGLTPALAKSWSQPNPTTLVYKLRHGVKFWDGTPLTADDVAFSMSLNMNKKVASQFSSFYSDVKWIRATANDEVTIKLHSPSPAAQFLAAFQGGFVVSRKFWEAHQQDIGTPQVLTMGTGPWKVTNFVPDQSVTFERNENYWGPKPEVRRVVLKFIPEESSRLLAMRSGGIDGAFDLPLGSLKQWQQIPGVKVLFASALQMPYFIFNVQRPPWNDVHARRAAAYALDRVGITKALLQGHGTPANAMAIPEMWGSMLSQSQLRRLYKSIPTYRYDLKKAKAELARSSHRKGFKTTIEYSNGIPLTGQISLVLAQGLAKIGIDLHVKEVPNDKWLADLYAHNQSMTVSLFGADYPDPAELVAVKMSSAGAIKNGYNFANYKNRTVDHLIAAQNAATNPHVRSQLIAKILRIAATDLPYLPVAWQQGAMAISSKYKFVGFGPWIYDQPWPERVKST
jgi:peptide/nickel transport system substrate-binding protein